MKLLNISEKNNFRSQSPELEVPKSSALIVEDCLSTALLIKYFLSEINLMSEIVNNGQHAIDKISENEKLNTKFNFIIIDHNLPDISGDRVTKILRDNSYNGIICGISAKNTFDVYDNFYSSGCDYFLDKNSLKEQLGKTIKYLAKTIFTINKLEQTRFAKNLSKPKPIILKSFAELKKVYKF